MVERKFEMENLSFYVNRKTSWRKWGQYRVPETPTVVVITTHDEKKTGFIEILYDANRCKCMCPMAVGTLGRSEFLPGSNNQ